jgi:2-methylcitrate dehydratase PrpD
MSNVLVSIDHDLATDFARFANRLTFSDLPELVVDKVKQDLLDTIGCALAALRADGVLETIATLNEVGNEGRVRLFGSSRGVSLPAAVIANTTMSRAHEFDTLHERALMRPAVACVPSGMALADWLGEVSGQRYLTAVTAGMELACRISLGGNYFTGGLEHQLRLFSFTYHCGVFGAATVAAKLLELDPSLFVSALGNAYSQLSGSQQVLEGYSLISRTQQGLSSWAGVLAALLARNGVTGPSDVFEGKYGYYKSFSGGNYDRATALHDLGSSWEVLNVSIKPFPCCKVTHPTVSGVLDLMELHRLSHEDVAEVRVQISNAETWDRVCDPVEAKQNVNDSVSAQYSMPFAAAAAAVYGSLGLKEMAAALHDPRVRDLMLRVTTVPPGDSELASRVMPTPFPVEIRINDGQSYSGIYQYAKGHPLNPMSWDEVVSKFISSCRFGSPSASERSMHTVVDLVQRLEGLDDMRELVDAVGSISGS